MFSFSIFDGYFKLSAYIYSMAPSPTNKIQIL